MSVQDEFGPMLCNGVLKAWPVDQTALSLSARPVRGMMDQDDPKHAIPTCFAQEFREALELRFAERAGRHERSGRNRGRHPDYRHLTTPPKIWESDGAVVRSDPRIERRRH